VAAKPPRKQRALKAQVHLVRPNQALDTEASGSEMPRQGIGVQMKSFTTSLVALVAVALLATSGAQAQDTQKPKGGTLKGAAVGAVAGHMMGGHTKTGAVAGAVIGHHEKVKSEKKISEGKGP
jgi:hypothetical protein